MRLRSKGPFGFFLRMTLAAIILAGCYVLLHRLMPGQTLRLVIVHAAALVAFWNAVLPADGLLPQGREETATVGDGDADAADKAEAAEPSSASPDADAADQPLAGSREPPSAGRSKRRHVHRRAGPRPIVYALPSFGDDDAFQPDARHLQLIYDARQKGDLSAYLQLGEIALQRGMLIEAYYWMALADILGVRNLTVTLRRLRVRWMKVGTPTEYDNVYEGFDEEQGEFARALLRIQCGVLAPLARSRMKKLAAAGSEEALLYLSHKPRRGK